MTPLTMGFISIAVLFLFLSMGMQIGVALAAAGFIGLWFTNGFEQMSWMAASGLYHKIASPDLITLPLFILMGYLASGGGISRQLFDSIRMWLGSAKSGIGIASVLGCSAFGTLCGSSLVTTAVFTKICCPEMRRQGYDKKLAYGITAVAGSIGMLIPPSVIAIVYGMLSGESIGKLLMAGVFPGILWAVLFSATIIVTGKLRPSSMRDVGTSRSPMLGEKLRSLIWWWPIVIVSLIMFGGMYGGVFTANEASAIAAFLLLIVFIAVRIAIPTMGTRRHAIADLHNIFKDTATTSAMIFLVIGAATIFADYIALTGLSKWVADKVMSWDLSKTGIIAIFMMVYLVLGIFLDSISMLAITIPIFNPIVQAAGIDPMWYATIVIVCIEIGLVTPPVGLNLYAAKGVAEPDVTLEDIIAGVLPFLVAMIFSLGVILLFPDMSTFLPGLIGK